MAIGSYIDTVKKLILNEISLQFNQTLSPDSAQHVHHMTVYICEGMNLTGHPDVGCTFDCDNITEQIRPCRASSIIAGWAVGGNVRHCVACNFLME